jgi:glycosyltransferase involved in cell wall biosynthesis
LSLCAKRYRRAAGAAGQGKPEQEQRLRQLAQQLQVADRVLFKGFQKNPLPWIKGARMLVLSSDSEGFGNVVVEALLLDTRSPAPAVPGGVTEILTGELPAAWRI